MANGVTATTMAVFNGSNELDQVLGLESLDLEAIESLGAAVKKVRKENYVSGLENKVSEYWAKFVQFLKDLWAKIKRWFKELFDKNAKYARLVDEAQKAGVFGKINYGDKDKKLSLISKAQFDAANAAAKALVAACSVGLDGKVNPPDAKVLAAAGFKLDGDKAVKADDFADKFKKEEKSLGEHFGSGSNVVQAVKDFKELAIGSKVKETVTNFDKAMTAMIKEAEAAEDDEGKQARVKEKKEGLPKLQSYLAAYNTLVGIMGNCLVTIVNKAKKAGDDAK